MALKGLGLPCMGSKRKIAGNIINTLVRRHPEATEFYDVFGGGGAMSFLAIQHPNIKTVYYNEYNKGLTELVKWVQNLPKDPELYKLGNILPDECYKWISREEFNELKVGDTWYNALVRCCWSFGNDGHSYMFGKDVEPIKKLAHNVVVYKDIGALTELNKTIGIIIPKEIIHVKCLHNSLHNRRVTLQNSIRKYKRVAELEQLERLQQLEQLQQLCQLQQLNVSNLDYREVKFNKGAIIYCDPPYEATSEYVDEFDSKAFYKWFGELNQPAYFSSYENAGGFQCIKEIPKIGLISAREGRKVKLEKLYWNGK